MKMEIECVTCFMMQAVKAAKLSTSDFKVRIKAVKKAAEVISGLDPTKTPPEIATKIFKTIARETGNQDAFKELKQESNKKVLELMNIVKKYIDEAEDRLATALKISLSGNIIDYGILDNFDVSKLIKEEINTVIDKKKVTRLKNIVIRSGIISFIADNAGEIGLDGILLKEFKILNPNLNIVIFVKSSPIINDATIEDARFFGIDKEFKIISAPNTVGLNLRLLPSNAKIIFEKSDYIIAKGQANYELLTDQNLKNIVYLLRAKCEVVAKDTGVKLGSPVLLV